MYYIEGSKKDFDSWMNVFDNAFMSLFNDDNTKSFIGENFASASFPPCNIYQKEDDTLVYELAVAGYSKDEIKVSYKDDYITVKLSTKEESEDEKKRTYAQKGIKHKDVETSYYVPLARYDVSNLKTILKDGLLTITIPYSENAKPKEFDVCIRYD